MPVVNRIVKPTTQRGKRFLKHREPLLKENHKTSIFIRGVKASDTVLQCMKDLNALKKPHTVYFGKKNPFLPFEDVTPIEFHSEKNDASLFMFGSHNKKRPHNIAMGRMYDHHLLDMFEFGIEHFKALKDFKVAKIPLGTKPCLVFTGEEFEREYTYQRLKNFFIDFFRGEEVSSVRLAGLEHALFFATIDGKVLIRSYKILLKKSGTKIPRIELEEIGPALDLVLRRTKLASKDLFKAACKQPRELKFKKVKNIKKNPFGTKVGRIHMQKQDLTKLQTRKMKGLKRSRQGKSKDNSKRIKT